MGEPTQMLKSFLLLPLTLAAQLALQTPTSNVQDLAWMHIEHTNPLLAKHVKSLPERRLVRWKEGDEVKEAWITEGQKALLVLNRIKFEDATDELFGVTLQKASPLPTELVYTAKDFQPIFETISIQRMTNFLSRFSAFRTRYYRSSEGKRSQEWLLQHIQALIEQKPKLNYSVSTFEHPWGQSSIVLHLPRQAKHHAGEDEVVVLGAHQDSTNLLPFLPAPGADDDGSGTTTILEVLTVLLESDFRPSNSSVEFHWYSAEEGGLLGSQGVANAYHQKGKPVKSMLQLDMTAYVKPGTQERIGLITDFVDSDLTDLLGKIVKEYATIPAVYTKCGYACSDHASWGKVGVRSAFAIEATFEDSNTHNIHTTGDKITVDGFSFAHMSQFVRVGVAYIKELSS